MANKQKLNDEFNILTNEEIQQSSDISQALALINKENIVTDIDTVQVKKFFVEKNKELQNQLLTNTEEKDNLELDEIANQADQAFDDLMNIAINTQGKACGDIASAANSFLNIKLTAKLSKMENKMKKLHYDLQVKKFEASIMKANSDNEDDEDDGIQIINN